jgi:hypothetical protein
MVGDYRFGARRVHFDVGSITGILEIMAAAHLRPRFDENSYSAIRPRSDASSFSFHVQERLQSL